MKFQERYRNLNKAQQEAVDTIDGPIMVIAGPGSGKTELLAVRTANILQKEQINPQNILILTFTDSATQNMRERLVNLIGETAYKVAIYTFHSFSSDIINRYKELFFDGANYRVATDVDRLNIIENVLENLPRGNKLGSRHFEMGFNFTSDIMSCISGLKKGNYSSRKWDEELNQLIKEWKIINHEIAPLFEVSSGKRKFEIVYENFQSIFNNLKKLNTQYANYLASTLSLELELSENTGGHKNLNNWRDEYFVNNENGDKILKDSRDEKVEKWKTLTDIYEKYIFEMNKKGFYDYDDMIFLVAKELSENSYLRNELEERYQYIMVDEFQDTNESQLSLIKHLTSSPVNEGRPNVLAVGDDDQAIYKFQGAELSNIYKFLNMYRDVKKIILTDNYRSTEKVLNYAANVSSKIADSVVKRDKDLNKGLVSKNANLPKGKIIEKQFENIHSEFDFIALEILNLLKDGVNPKEISIIGKKHATLRAMTNVFNTYKIPYAYEKREHVLSKQIIKEIITILEFVESGLGNLKEELLPEILSYKFWNIDRVDIWNIANSVRKGEEIVNELGTKSYKRVSWLDACLKSENTKIVQVANFLVSLLADAHVLPLEYIIDKIIGTKEWDNDDEYVDREKISDIKKEFIKNGEFISPYKEYYFSKENFENKKQEYLDFLFSLRTFIGALREFKKEEILYVKDLPNFLNVYKNNDNLTLTTVSPFATGDNTITLQTAHKSKGLEYEYVFIVDANEKEWNGRGHSNKIGLPEHLKLLADQDTEDDKIRLLYVAITRAKHTLYVTYSKEQLGFTMSDDEGSKKTDKPENTEITNNILESLALKEVNPIFENEKTLLKKVLENYLMPVTHMNNFLDLSRVGPAKFIEQNLLKFPQAMNPSSIYGSAMHEAIQNYYLYYKKYKKFASLERLKAYFENSLLRANLTSEEYKKYLNSGLDNLEIYEKELKKKGAINETDLVEHSFKHEGVTFGIVKATGKIDKIQFDGKKVITVTDFKTGKSYSSWDKVSQEYEKIKLHFYQYQLAYYVLLINNSRSFHNYKVQEGILEFLEADEGGKINRLKLEIDKELVSRVEKLANIVYKKIINLDFPNTYKYSHNELGEEKDVRLKDILDFEEDLLNNKI